MPPEIVTVPTQVPVRESHVDVGKARLWHWDTGGGGEPVVLCHPASQSCRIWLHQQPAFAAAGYRVIGYSRRGVWPSEAGPADDRGTAVGDLAGVLDALGLAKVHLLGAAAGGISALAFAVAHPTRVLSLTLAGTIFSPDEDEWRTMYARLGLAAVRPVVTTEFLELGPSYRALDPAGTKLFLDLEHKAKSAGGAVPQPVGAKVTWVGIAAARVRTLLVTGEADLYAPPPLQALVARHMPVHEAVTLREVGHAPYWEAPGEFNRIVLRFLAGGAADAAAV